MATMHRSLRPDTRSIEMRSAKTRTTKDYLQSMRLWTNFFAVSGAELDFIEKTLPSKGVDILEVGCGNGRLSLKLADTARSVTGIDIDSRLIDFANKYSGANQIANIKFQEMSTDHLDFEDCTFDLVLMPWMLHQVQDRKRALSEVRRILRPGGKLIVFALFGDCDYDRIARHFISSRDKEMDPVELYESPLASVFGQYTKELIATESTDYSFIFPDCGVTAEAFEFAFSNWYERFLHEKERSRLRHLIQNHRLGNHIELKTRGAIYTAEA